MGEAGVWPVAELKTPSAPNGNDSLGGSLPKVIPKVTGSGGLPLFYTCFTPPEPDPVVGAGRRRGGVHGQQQCYGWLCECEVKETSMLAPAAPCSA